MTDARTSEGGVKLTKAKDTCETCRFWVPLQFSGGSCHRYPPRPIYQVALDGSGGSYGDNLRPFTEAPEWCGEWTFAGKLHAHGAGRAALSSPASEEASTLLGGEGNSASRGLNDDLCGGLPSDAPAGLGGGGE